MALTQEQIKGRIKNIAKENKADARVLIRIYMMERFLERVANSPYAENFVIKGGILVTSMVGVALRSTMDIDTSIRNLNLSKNDIRQFVEEICDIDMGDDVSFVIRDISDIMDDMEYPGIRVSLDAALGKMITPIKIDISAGDAITPRAIEYDYKLMLEDRSIRLWSYNLETIIAEKMQTVLSRGVLNTRMRDFYDLYTLSLRYGDSIDSETLGKAFEATCRKRGSLKLIESGNMIIDNISENMDLNRLWQAYRKKYSYAADLPYNIVIRAVRDLYTRIIK
jgi:predicted nucleotidyltransferase component of viral defense system